MSARPCLPQNLQAHCSPKCSLPVHHAPAIQHNTLAIQHHRYRHAVTQKDRRHLGLQRCEAQKLKKLETSAAEVTADAVAALPSISSLQQQLQPPQGSSPTPQDAARVLLLLGKHADLRDLAQEDREAASCLLATVAVLLNDRSESVAQATSFANNLHTMWRIESTAPPRIQLLTSAELRKASWALSKLRARLGLEQPQLLQGILTQLAFDQDE